MRIGIDGTPAINDIRAIQRYTGNLIRELSNIDHDNLYSILCLGCKKSINKPFSDIYNPKFSIITSNFPGKILKTSWSLTGYPKFSSWINGKVDILHFPGGYAYVPTSGEKVLTTLHGFHHQIIPHRANEKFKATVLNMLDKTIRLSNNIITVSETNKRELMEIWNVPGDKITPIPLGISTEFRQIEISENDKISFLSRYSLKNKPFILYVGALEPHKNIDGIISAYSILGNDFYKHFNLVLIGAETEYLDKYKRMISNFHISEYVSFINYITPGSEDLTWFYNLAELFVFPSFYEGWASPPLESFKCGTPALVSDIPSLRESTGGTTCYCNPNDPEDIASKVILMIEDHTLYKEILFKGLDFAMKCTWQKCARQTLELYKSAAQS